MPIVPESHCRGGAFALCVAAILISACGGAPFAQRGRSLEDAGPSLEAVRVLGADAHALAAHRLAAEAGDPREQTLMGLLYRTGQNVPRDDAEAARWLRLAAEQGECAGQYQLGLLYLQGRGVPRDIDQAAYWLRRAQGHSEGTQLVSFGSLYDRLRDVAGAAVFRGASDASPREAPYEGETLYQLGEAYLEGRGVPVDPAHALLWFRMAAEDGHAEAQYRVGFAYRNGIGTPRDLVRAHQWLSLAAASGSALARDELAQLEPELTPEEVAEAELRALEWRRQHPQR